MSAAESDLSPRATAIARGLAAGQHGEEGAKSLWRRACEQETKRSRLTPRRFDATMWLEMAVRAAPHRFRRVPASAIAEDGADSDGDYALIRCPCGQHPIARSLIAKCECERWYMLAELGNVWVVYGEMEPPPLP